MTPLWINVAWSAIVATAVVLLVIYDKPGGKHHDDFTDFGY